MFKRSVNFYALKGTEKYSYLGELVDSKLYGDEGFELTYKITYNDMLITIIIDSEGRQIIDNSTIYFTDWDVCESYRVKKVFQSTLREYYGDAYEEYYEELSEILFEEVTEGLRTLTIEERIECTLRDFFMDLEVLNDELDKSTLLTLQDQKHYVKMPDGSYNTLHWNKLSDEQRANIIDRTMVRNGSIANVTIDEVTSTIIERL